MNIPLDVLSLFVTLGAGFVAIFLRVENRLTKLETRICALPCLKEGCKKP